jgi:hypothetical protein
MRADSLIELPCPPVEAWRTLTHWERQADWMLDADHIDVLTEQREGVGVRLDVRTRLFQVRAFTETMEIVAWDPPHRLEIVHGPPVRGLGTWTLEPTAAGTWFTWTEEVALSIPLVGAAAAIVYAPVARWLMRRSQRALKALVLASGPVRDD